MLGTLRVLEAARAAGAQLVFSSTGGAIYGECTRPAREDDPREPLSPYGTSKLAGEEYLAAWNRLHAMRNVALRFANVYGPRQLAKLEGGVVAIFIDRLARRRARDDLRRRRADARLRLRRRRGGGAPRRGGPHGGGVFNVGTGVETSVNRLYAVCRETAGRGDDPEHGPARAGDLLRSVLDPGAAERALGWRPVETLESGLRRTWEWPSAG